MKLNTILNIQRQFRLQQIKRNIKLLNYNKITIENNTFEEFTKNIQDKNILFLVDLILTKITQIVKYGAKNIITSKDFLSSFVIHGYTNEIINEEPTVIREISGMNKIIISLSEEIVTIFDRFFYTNISLYSIHKFADLLIDYKIIFDSWKIKDHTQLVHELVHAYYDLKESIKDIEERLNNSINETTIDNELLEESAEYIKLCHEKQIDIKSKIDALHGQEYFNNYKREEIRLDESILRQIKATVHAAFWDSLHEDLATEPPKYDKLISLLVELRDTFCNLVPNRSDIHAEIHENIDVDLIKNMVEHDAFDDESLQKLAVYIISLVKKFQPPVMDEGVQNWEQGMMEQFNSKFEYSDFLVMFFKSVFNMLDEIVISAKQFMNDYEEQIAST